MVWKYLRFVNHVERTTYRIVDRHRRRRRRLPPPQVVATTTGIKIITVT
jgi:hypothetical protein